MIRAATRAGGHAHNDKLGDEFDRVIRIVDGRIASEANYAVFRTKLNELSTVFNVGRYIDTVVSTPRGLKFESRLVVYDSEMIPNSIIYPI